MSFLKFWGKKDKKDGADGKKDDPALDPELEKRKLRHSLSISRSGRFKQKKRERGQILDKPELFTGQEGGDGNSESASSESSPRPTRQTPANAVHPRSPNNTCRDVNNKMAPGSLRMGQSVVT